MMEYVRMVISTCVTLTGFWLAADIVFEEKSRKDFLTIVIVLLGGMIISIFNLEKLINFFSYVKIFLIFLMMTIFYKNKYRIGTSDALIGSAIIYGNLVIAEVLLTLILSVLDFIFNSEIYLIARYSIIAGILIAIISIIILKLLYKRKPSLFRKIRNRDSKLVLPIISIFLIIAITLGFIPLNNLSLGIEMFLLVLVIIGFIIVTLYILKEKIEKVLEEKEKLIAEGIKVSDTLQVGIMIEIPAAAVLADQFAKEVDFFSIGTNDLIQYTFAADRMSSGVSYLYQPFNPSILRLIKFVIDSAHNEGKWVGMCGEMAGEPLAGPLLLGLGLDEFSMSATSILAQRKLIRSLSKAEMVELANKAINCSTMEEVVELVEKIEK